MTDDTRRRPDPPDGPADPVGADSLGTLGASIVSAYGKLITPRIAPHAITLIQLGILNACLKGRADTVSGLATVIPVDAGSLSRHVDKLVKQGLLRRRRSQRDRRVVRLELTDEGTALVRELTHAVREVNAALLSGVSEDEQQCLVSVVRKIVENAARSPG
ncbi:MAG: MarR family winged helix-turn-helix transcriptional regulator [Chloroflexota bacterium]|nr:MarR family winged helix-turn-helix transcriptional regulator [Chloroflexota bacterium]